MWKRNKWEEEREKELPREACRKARREEEEEGKRRK